MPEFKFTTHREIWSAKITSKEQAISIIKTISTSLYFLAGFYIIVAFLSRPDFVFDGVVIAILSSLLRKFHSRAVAVILSLLSLYAFSYAILSGVSWYVYYLLLGAVVWASIRAIQATFALRKFKG